MNKTKPTEELHKEKEEYKKYLIKKLIRAGLIKKQPVRLKQGEETQTYYDFKTIYGHPDLLNELADMLAEHIHQYTTCIAGAGYGGIPLATIIATKYNYNLTLIREKQKKQGLPGIFVGHQPNHNDYIAIVDDVCTSGKSIDDAVKKIEQTNAIITGTYVLLNRGSEDAINALFKPIDFTLCLHTIVEDKNK